jgi:hypothetical protein
MRPHNPHPRFQRYAFISYCCFTAFAVAAGGAETGKSKVFCAGFAFSGNDSEVKTNYPISSMLDVGAADQCGFIQANALSFFKKNNNRFSKIDLQFGKARPEDTPLVLALAMTDEKVLREEFPSFHKLVVQLGFELLVLDFNQKTVEYSRPIYIELIDAAHEPFSDGQVAERVRKMIQGDDSQLFTALTDKCESTKICGKNQCTLQVRNVVIGEKALPFLLEGYKQAPNVYAQAVAEQFGALLTANAGVALLPYAKDGLNSKMSLRFEDQSMVQFKIPPPTFAVDIDVKGFKKVFSKSTDAESLWIYGAFLGIRVYEPEFQKVYFEAPVKYGVSKVVPASQKNVDEFPIVSEALKGAIVTAIEQIQKDPNAQTKVIKKCAL